MTLKFQTINYIPEKKVSENKKSLSVIITQETFL